MHVRTYGSTLGATPPALPAVLYVLKASIQVMTLSSITIDKIASRVDPEKRMINRMRGLSGCIGPTHTASLASPPLVNVSVCHILLVGQVKGLLATLAANEMTRIWNARSDTLE